MYYCQIKYLILIRENRNQINGVLLSNNLLSTHTWKQKRENPKPNKSFCCIFTHTTVVTVRWDFSWAKADCHERRYQQKSSYPAAAAAVPANRQAATASVTASQPYRSNSLIIKQQGRIVHIQWKLLQFRQVARGRQPQQLHLSSNVHIRTTNLYNNSEYVQRSLYHIYMSNSFNARNTLPFSFVWSLINHYIFENHSNHRFKQ